MKAQLSGHKAELLQRSAKVTHLLRTKKILWLQVLVSAIAKRFVY
jgi:hypothetical protein